LNLLPIIHWPDRDADRLVDDGRLDSQSNHESRP
jgi:hypothetical protein